MNIVVFGAGYVGLSLSVLLAQKNKVTIVDIVEEKIKMISNKKSPIEDKEIIDFLKNKKLNLNPTTDGKKYLDGADFVIIATPTNYDPNVNSFDTSSVENVIKMCKDNNYKGNIVIKSTIPVDYTKTTREKFGISNLYFSPEFLREGKALYDNLYPSRIIVGCNDEDEKEISVAKTFANLLKDSALANDVKTLIMGTSEAEAVKLFANTYLALRVSFFNELDTYAEVKKLKTKNIIDGVCLDPRVGTHYNNPSFGYGGYCLPKDTKQLLANYKGVPEDIIRAIVESNKTRKNYITNSIIKLLENKKNKTVGIFRLAMKFSSDNFRNSSILGIIQRLKENNVNVIIYEPTLKCESFIECDVVNDIDAFKEKAGIIVTNRYSEALEDVKDKVYSRDLFGRD